MWGSLVSVLLVFTGCQQGTEGLTGAGFNESPSLGSRQAELQGAESSGGTDNLNPAHGAAWFLGAHNTIKYCYSVAEGFGVDGLDLEQSIEAAFRKWGDYIIKKQVSWGGVTFATKLKLQRCDGTEDLKFYFGTQDNKTRVAVKALGYPVAFAAMTSFDFHRNWGKGYVWISAHGSLGNGYPDWKLADSRDSVLLHEIGHIFGCGHVNGTVMSFDLAGVLSQGRGITSIDYSRELSHCTDCRTTYAAAPRIGSIEVVEKGFGENYLPQAFERLIGQPPSGQVTATFTAEKTELDLTLGDSFGSHTFRIERTQLLSSMKDSVLLFKSSRGLVRLFTGYTFLGILQDVFGNATQVTYSLNMNEAAVSIEALTPSGLQTLFYSFGPREEY